MAAVSQALITFCLWYSFKSHMDEASTTPQPIFQRLGLMVVIRGTFLTLAQLVLVIIYLAKPDQLWWMVIHQALPPLYYMTAISTLNIRLELLEQPRIDEESQSDSVSEPGIYVKTPASAGGGPFMVDINCVSSPGPASDTRSVEARQKPGTVPGVLRPSQGDNTKKIRIEWTPQDESAATRSIASQDSSPLPALAPNRLNKDFESFFESASSKEAESTISVIKEGTDRPRFARQFLGVFKLRGGK
ncbi:hypothetical protein PM082_011249 [Marasmius tenuissimus]|nr:hypothetical protein PM082_011249 [Marasmius tenuissimus]